TGYGEPIQKQFKLKDGERIVAAMSLDPRAAGDIRGPEPGSGSGKGNRAPDPVVGPAPVHAVAVSSDGYALRFNLDAFVEPSTRSGRRYARPAEGAEIVNVVRLAGGEVLIGATADARGILCPGGEGDFIAGAGQGRLVIRQ